MKTIYSGRLASTLLSALVAGSFLAPQIARADEDWTLQSPTTNPPSRYYHAMAYDSLNSQTVLVGGVVPIGGGFPIQNGYDQRTWLWDGHNWSPVVPTPSPSPRFGHVMANDSVNHRVVLFGGYSSGTVLNDTWLWDGTQWSLQNPTHKPPARFDGAMAYDEVNHKVVLFGGQNFDIGLLTDTWVWDGIDWTNVSPASAASPAPRIWAAMAFDGSNHNIVLFGGRGASNDPLGDTWSWNGSAWNLASTSGPTPRAGPAMAFDPGHQTTVLFGGSDSSNSFLNETWFWDGTSWTQLLPATTPPGRDNSAMIFDGVNQKLLIFGGFENPWPSLLPDTWLFGGSAAQTAVTITVPTGIQFTFNGKTYTGSQTISVAPGSYTLSANSPQATGAGSQAVWVSWDDGGGQSHSVTVGSTALTITGTYKAQYLLTTTASPTVGGSVLPITGYIDSGAPVTVTASANLGYAFASWSGDCSGTGTCSFNMSKPMTVTGNFAVTGFPVTINVPNGIQFSLDGIPYTGSQTVALGGGGHTLSTSSPQPAGTGTRAVFVSWSDRGPISHQIAVGGPLTITGTFKMQYLLTLMASPVSEGIVTATNGPDAPYYDLGTSLQVQAVPNANFEFDYWTVDCAGANPLCPVTMNGPRTAIAHFSVVENWVQLYPATNPAARVNAAMAYDAMNQNVVMFGGLQGAPGTGATVLGDTWLWDGSSWARQKPVASPSPRWGAMTAYDAARGQVVLYGGRPDSTSAASAGLTDTWVWDLANNTWTRKSTAGPPRYEGSMAYDPQSNLVILFGGASGGGTWNDTWGWDGVTWKKLNPLTSPSPRGLPAVTFHAANQPGLVLFGGAGSVNSDGRFPVASELNDTWQWSGSNWTLRAPAHRPPAQATPTMAYNSATMETMLFESSPFIASGGQQTWAWDGNDWFQKTPVSLLPNRDRQVVTYDAARNEVLIFGGINYATGRVYNDTWAWLAPVVSLVPQFPVVTRNGSGTYDVTISLANNGNVPATNVSLTSVAVGGAANKSVSTVGLIDRNTTGSFTVKLQVSSAGAPGTNVTAAFSGKFDADGATGIPWTATFQVNLP